MDILKKEKTKFTAKPREVEALKDLVVQSLHNDKAQDIVVIDLKGKADFAAYMIVCSARSTMHANSTGTKLIKLMRDIGIEYIAEEGMPHGEWVLVDLFDVIVHIFIPEVREYYAIEKMWRN